MSISPSWPQTSTIHTILLSAHIGSFEAEVRNGGEGCLDARRKREAYKYETENEERTKKRKKKIGGGARTPRENLFTGITDLSQSIGSCFSSLGSWIMRLHSRFTCLAILDFPYNTHPPHRSMVVPYLESTCLQRLRLPCQVDFIRVLIVGTLKLALLSVVLVTVRLLPDH